jgi:hypothetical protein
VTLGSLLPPLTAATTLSIFVFAAAWHADRVEKRTGVLPWWIIATSLLLGVPFVVFLYYARNRALSGGLDIFCIAVAANVVAAGIAYGLLRFIGSVRSETGKDRAISILGGAVILFCVALLAFKY